jgi:hypothetical protein
MKWHVYGRLALGAVGLITLVLASVVPGEAWQGHGRGFTGPRVVGPVAVVGPRVVAGPRVVVGPRFLGPPRFIGAPYWYPYALYYPYYAPVYARAVLGPSPPAYVEPDPPAQYWYYCQNPQGYHPYVQQCPGGWMQVVPNPQ